MGGSNQVKRAWALEEEIPDQDGLRRIIFFGEALRAVGSNVSDSLINGPTRPILVLLNEAYERIAAERPGFTVEEYTLFVMSVLLDLCEDPVEAQQMKRGAAAYLLQSAPKLPGELSELADEAQSLLDRESEAFEAGKAVPTGKGRREPLLLTRMVGKPEKEPESRADATARRRAGTRAPRAAATDRHEKLGSEPAAADRPDRRAETGFQRAARSRPVRRTRFETLPGILIFLALIVGYFVVISAAGTTGTDISTLSQSPSG